MSSMAVSRHLSMALAMAAAAPAFADDAIPPSVPPPAKAVPMAPSDPGTTDANNAVAENLRNIAARDAAAKAAFEKAKADAAAKAAEQDAEYAKTMAAWRSTVAQSNSQMDAWKQATDGGKHAPAPSREQVASLGTAQRADSQSQAAKDREIVVTGTHRVCKLVGGDAPIGSMISARPKRVCYDKAELARNAAETDRTVRDLVAPHGGDIYAPK